MDKGSVEHFGPSVRIEFGDPKHEGVGDGSHDPIGMGGTAWNVNDRGLNRSALEEIPYAFHARGIGLGSWNPAETTLAQC